MESKWRSTLAFVGLANSPYVKYAWFLAPIAGFVAIMQDEEGRSYLVPDFAPDSAIPSQGPFWARSERGDRFPHGFPVVAD